MTPYSLGKQFRQSFQVTPDNLQDLARAGAQLYVSNGGDVRVNVTGSASPITIFGVPSGSYIPVLVDRVYSAGTTASGILALYSKPITFFAPPPPPPPPPLRIN